MKKFNVLRNYRRSLKKRSKRRVKDRSARIALTEKHLSSNIKELRDRDTGRCIGQIEKEGSLYKAINYKKSEAAFVSIRDAVSFILETYNNSIHNSREVVQQLKL